MKYAMVIDQQLCVGCAACTIACKAENNTPESFNWCDKITRTEGRFPNVKYEYISTMCNHCEDAPCVSACPTQAMYKDENGLTLHDPKKCIGCKACVINCPYGVISINWEAPHNAWAQTDALVAGGTYSPAELVAAVGGEGSPHGNPERANSYPVVRSKGTVEKCNFCDHRLKVGLEPACVMACPSRARIVGDLEDPKSEVNALIARHGGRGLREELGTKPRVFYIRNYSPQRRA